VQIKFTLMQRTGRPHIEIQWLDPVTEKYRTRTTKTSNHREAERFAAKLMASLEAGEDAVRHKATFDAFEEAYKKDRFPGLKPKTRNKVKIVFKLIRDVLNPARLAVVQEPQITKIKDELAKRGRSQYTVISYMAVLNKMLNWALDEKYIARIPKITMPPVPSESHRGRPLAGEERERMHKVTAEVVGETHAPEWIRLMEGLDLSGFRLGEALVFHWKDDHEISPDLSGKHPLLKIQGSAEKAGTYRNLPMTPDFARWLLQTPEHERRGYVFRPIGIRGVRVSVDRASKIIAEIGKAARVKVAPKKFASAHDFRRTFGLRWAMKVRPAILMQLMRHASIATTLKYYAHVEAQTAADEIWRGETNDSTNIHSSDLQK